MTAPQISATSANSPIVPITYPRGILRSHGHLGRFIYHISLTTICQGLPLFFATGLTAQMSLFDDRRRQSSVFWFGGPATAAGGRAHIARTTSTSPDAVGETKIDLQDCRDQGVASSIPDSHAYQPITESYGTVAFFGTNSAAAAFSP